MTDLNLVHVGWMLPPDLASEFGITPLSGDYLITLAQAERDGGIKDEFADRVIPIYRKADVPDPWAKRCAYCGAAYGSTNWCCDECFHDRHAHCPSWPSCTRPDYGRPCDAT